MVMSLAGYAYAFRSCQNIYGTLIHCENLKIIEIMFTVQIITVKSIHCVENGDVHCTNIVKSIHYVEMHIW